ncbi:MAG: S8 family serine peptidase [Chloroflexi bacterium]|nr:S8 family serine peptidase [Chloroflexota bacterium]
MKHRIRPILFILLFLLWLGTITVTAAPDKVTTDLAEMVKPQAITARNETGVSATGTHTTVIINAAPAAVAPVTATITGPQTGQLGVPYTFTITIDPVDVTMPITYEAQYTDGSSPLGPFSLPQRVVNTPSITWTIPGTKTVWVKASNEEGFMTGTHEIVISEAPVDPQAQVILTGPANGMTNQPYIFTATISPTTATKPITYTFMRTDGSGPLSSGPVDSNAIALQNVIWTTPGTKVVTATAQNADGTYIDTLAVEITSGTIFLPLVLKGYTPPFSPSEDILWNLAAMRVPEAWASSTGQGIVIADIGTGVDLDHPDLAANIVGGYNFVNDTTVPEDDVGTGTFIAGIIAGVPNNGGIVGVAPHAKIMPVKVIDSNGAFTSADVAAGIRWAYDNGARLINLSFMFTMESATIDDALEHAFYALVFGMEGDCGGTDYADHGCTIQNQNVWPARYANVEGIGSTDIDNQLSDFSTEFQPMVVAPGEGIYSTGLNGGYATGSSTGYASAHAAGVAALVWAANPTYYDGDVRGAILHSADDLGYVTPSMAVGFGLIDAAAAITQNPSGGWAKANTDTVQPSVSGARSLDAPRQTTTMMEDEVLVKLSDGASLGQVWNEMGFKLSELRVLDVIEGLNVYRLSVPTDQQTAIISGLLETPGVEYAEPNHLVMIK